MSLTKEQLFPENGVFMISGNDLVSCVIYEAIKCKHFPTIPRKVDIIVEKVTELYQREFEKITDDFYLKGFDTQGELLWWLSKHLLAIPEIEELNLSQVEYNAGIKVHDEKRIGWVFTSAYSKNPPKEDDFVDLDAYVRNISHDLIRNCIEINFSTFSDGWPSTGGGSTIQTAEKPVKKPTCPICGGTDGYWQLSGSWTCLNGDEHPRGSHHTIFKEIKHWDYEDPNLISESVKRIWSENGYIGAIHGE